jgi:hypothetical protein
MAKRVLFGCGSLICDGYWGRCENEAKWHPAIPIRSATDISHIAKHGVINCEAEIYDFHRLLG